MITEKQLLDNYRKAREKYKDDPETLGRLKELLKNQIIELRSKNTKKDTSSIEFETYGYSPEMQESLMDTTYIEGVTPEYKMNLSDEALASIEESGEVISVKEDIKDMSSYFSETPTPFEIDITFDNGATTKVYANQDYNEYDMKKFIEDAYKYSGTDLKVTNVKSTISTDPKVLRDYTEKIGIEEPWWYSHEGFPRASRAALQTEDPDIIRGAKVAGGTALDVASAPFRVFASLTGNIGEEDYLEKVSSDIGRVGGEESEDIASAIAQDIIRDPLNVFAVGTVGNLALGLARGAKKLGYKAIGREISKSPSVKKFFTAKEAPKVINEISDKAAKKLLSPDYKSQFTESIIKARKKLAGRTGQVLAGAAQGGLGEVEDIITGGDRYDLKTDLAFGAIGQLASEKGVKALEKTIKKLKKGLPKVKFDALSDMFKRDPNQTVLEFKKEGDEIFGYNYKGDKIVTSDAEDEVKAMLEYVDSKEGAEKLFKYKKGTDVQIEPEVSGTIQEELLSNKKLMGFLEKSSSKVVKALEKVLTAEELATFINNIGGGINLLLMIPAKAFQVVQNFAGIGGKDAISIMRVLEDEYDKNIEEINKAKALLKTSKEFSEDAYDIYKSDDNEIKKGFDALKLGDEYKQKFDYLRQDKNVPLDVLLNYQGQYSSPKTKQNPAAITTNASIKTNPLIFPIFNLLNVFLINII